MVRPRFSCLDVVAVAAVVVVVAGCSEKPGGVQKTQFCEFCYALAMGTHLSYSAQTEANQLCKTFGLDARIQPLLLYSLVVVVVE